MLTNTRPVLVALAALASVTFVIAACGSDGDSTFGDPDAAPPSFDPDGSFGNPSTKPDSGDLFANDPPPKYCGPDPKAAPPQPGGTADCPDDKNKPGCGCDKLDEVKDCWTGLRVNRELGVCKDGVTKCVQKDENTKVWGPCEGQVLPTPGATKGAAACKCFSLGQWKLANLSPCFREYCNIDPGAGPCPAGNVAGYHAASTFDDGTGGGSKCTDQGTTPPGPVPPGPWTTSTLKVDCAGEYELCYELKAGDFANPQANDCSLTKQCVKARYLTANVEQPFGDLPAWVSPNQDCAKKWNATGGYGEMTVKGLSDLCDKIDDGAGNSYVFNRVKYCPSLCRDAANASKPECQNCAQGGSGEF